LERPFNPFITSLFKDGIKKECISKTGVFNVEGLAEVYQNGFWYESEEVWNKM